MSDQVESNDQLLLIVGYSSMGKSASLRNIRDQADWLYLNSESGKRLPFKNQFQNYRISDPYQILEAFDFGTDNSDVKGAIIDSLTFLMDMYETQYVVNATNTMAGWSNFAQYFKQMMQEKVVLFNKPTIFTAHVRDDLDEKNMEMKTAVPIKGALKNNGVEAYFSTVVAAKRLAVKDLMKTDFDKDLLHISEEEEELGFKHVFQTRITKATTGERIRSPMGMFNKAQTYMDNDAQLLLDYLDHYYS